MTTSIRPAEESTAKKLDSTDDDGGIFKLDDEAAIDDERFCDEPRS